MIMEDNQLIAHFSDIYNVRPFHYECTIGQIKLPWNKQVIDIFTNHDVETYYRPVVDGVYAEEGYGIWLTGKGFSEQDLSDYLKKVEEYKAHQECVHDEIVRVLSEVYEVIKEKVPQALDVHALEEQYLVYCDEYALSYSPDKKEFYINKYNSNQPIDKMYYWWNKDKEFISIESSNQEEIISQFITLIEQKK